MARVEFKFMGLDEFREDLQKVVSKYPDKAETEVYHLAGAWTKDVNEKLRGAVNHPDTGKRPLTKSWKRSRSFGGMAGAEMVAVEITNTAPHWHLIENGHRVLADPNMAAAFQNGRLDRSKRKGRRKGKSPKLKHLGNARPRHCAQDTREEWDNGIFSGHIAKFLDKTLKEENL